MSVNQDLLEIEELEKVASTSSPLANWARQEAISKRAKLQLTPEEVQFREDSVWSPLSKGKGGQGPTMAADYAGGGSDAGSFHSGSAGFSTCPLCSGAGTVPKKNSAPSDTPTEAVTSDADANVAVDGESASGQKAKKGKKRK
jgi:hypothetical protein